MTLTYKYDLDNLPSDLHAEIQVQMSFHLAMRVVTVRQTLRTDRHAEVDFQGDIGLQIPIETHTHRNVL